MFRATKKDVFLGAVKSKPRALQHFIVNTVLKIDTTFHSSLNLCALNIIFFYSFMTMHDDKQLDYCYCVLQFIIFELIVCLIRAGCHSVKEWHFLKINGKFRVRTKKVSFQIVNRK